MTPSGSVHNWGLRVDRNFTYSWRQTHTQALSMNRPLLMIVRRPSRSCTHVSVIRWTGLIRCLIGWVLNPLWQLTLYEYPVWVLVSIHLILTLQHVTSAQKLPGKYWTRSSPFWTYYLNNETQFLRILNKIDHPAPPERHEHSSSNHLLLSFCWTTTFVKLLANYFLLRHLYPTKPKILEYVVISLKNKILITSLAEWNFASTVHILVSFTARQPSNP